MVLVLLVTLFAIVARAQTQGEITGEVADSSGAVIPGATVIVTNEGTNVSRQVTTNNTGRYSFPSLNPGTYKLRVETPGFQAEERNGVLLQVQQVARLDFRLTVGQANETISVAASAEMISTENATTGTVIENKTIVEMPLNGRNFLQLVALSPNVSYGFGASTQQTSQVGGQRAAQTISVAGARSEFNHFTLDGIENTDNNYNNYVFLPSIDAIEEFKVQTGVYPAEFGRNLSQINVSTKSGTNNYHGALFEFLRNAKMDANQFAFTSVVPTQAPLIRNQYGFTLGGPVFIPKVFNGKNRLFFMVNYEALRERTGRQTVASVPSAAMRTGDFREIAQTIFDPATRVRNGNTITATPFAGKIIPTNRLNEKSLGLLQYYPLPNVPGAGAVNNYQQLVRQTQDTDQFTTRIDFAESANSNWFGRWSWDDEYGITPQGFPGQGQKVVTQAQQVIIANTRILSPSVVNEFRAGYNLFKNDSVQENANVNNVIGQIGGIPGIAIPTPIIYGIPNIGITGYTGFGDIQAAPNVSRQNAYQWVDNMSMLRGQHSIRFGVDIRREQFNQTGNQFPRGSFSFSGQATQNPQSTSNTGNGMADFLLGQVRTSSGALGLAVAQLRGTRQYYYFDDTWKINSKLTLSLGLRYELAPPYYDKHYGAINVDIPSLSDPTRRPTLVRAGTGNFFEGLTFTLGPEVQVARDGRLGRSLVKTDYSNIAPRVGLAYSVSRKLVIRSGFGRFFATDIGNSSYDLARNLFVRRTATADSNFPNLTIDNPFQSAGVQNVVAPLPLGTCYCLERPYVFQYLFNIQYEVTKNSVLEVGYSGSQGHKLAKYIGRNFPAPGPGNVQSRRPYTEFANIFYMESGVNSNYNALTAKLTERMARTLTAIVSYTYSKSIDNGSSVRGRSGDAASENSQNPYDQRAERGVSIFNSPQRFSTSLIWEPPVGKGRWLLSKGGVPGAILGNWQIGSIFTAISGFPFTVTSGIDDANIGPNSTQRPDYSGVPITPVSGVQDPQQWFNPAAFKRVAPFTFGNVGRNTMVGPGLFGWDFSAMKTILLPDENHRLQFRFEAFNFPNHPNFGIPGASLTSAGFGTITTTATKMREMQVSLKYIF